MGPGSTMACRARDACRVSLEGWPGGLRLTRPAGPWALTFTTQSRTTCSVTPPIRAGSVRAAPKPAPTTVGPAGPPSSCRPSRATQRHQICSERNRHGEPPSFASLNQTCPKPTRPKPVTPLTAQPQTSHPLSLRDSVLVMAGIRNPSQELPILQQRTAVTRDSKPQPPAIHLRSLSTAQPRGAAHPQEPSPGPRWPGVRFMPSPEAQSCLWRARSQ